MASGIDLNGTTYVNDLAKGTYTLALTDKGGYQVTKTIDVNAKVNWKNNNNNRFFAAFYAGRDVFKFSDEFGFGWRDGRYISQSKPHPSKSPLTCTGREGTSLQ